MGLTLQWCVAACGLASLWAVAWRWSDHRPAKPNVPALALGGLAVADLVLRYV